LEGSYTLRSGSYTEGSYTLSGSYTPSGSYTQSGSYTPSGSYTQSGSYTPSGTYTSTDSRTATDGQWTLSTLQSYTQSGSTTPFPTSSLSSGRSTDEEPPSDIYHTVSAGSLDSDYVTANAPSETSYASFPTIPSESHYSTAEVCSMEYSTADVCSTEYVTADVCVSDVSSSDYVTAELCKSLAGERAASIIAPSPSEMGSIPSDFGSEYGEEESEIPLLSRCDL